MQNLNQSARRITLTLFSAQSLASAGFIAAATLNSILGDKLGGQASWAGVPSAVYLVGGAGAAFLWGYLMDLWGRRAGLIAGLALGALGAGLAFQAVALNSLLVFLLGMVLMGAANAAVTLGRFAAAEVHPPGARGRAISNVVLGGAVGAIFGPLMVEPMGRLAQSRGFEELSGAYAASGLLFILACLAIFAWLRPDPRDLGREVARLYPEASSNDGDARSKARSIGQILRLPAAIVAILAMALGQMVMVMVMVITALHMREHQHGLGSVSLVISAHTFGMYGFSMISGRLADRWGRGPVIISGAATLLLACLAATLSPQVLPLAVSLFLLGLGWNFCFVGGSTLLADQLSPAERARTQGFNDLLVGIASAAASLGSGVIFAALGYTVMALAGATFSLAPLLAATAWLKGAHSSKAQALPNQ
jgi:MFS family permease